MGHHLWIEAPDREWAVDIRREALCFRCRRQFELVAILVDGEEPEVGDVGSAQIKTAIDMLLLSPALVAVPLQALGWTLIRIAFEGRRPGSFHRICSLLRVLFQSFQRRATIIPMAGR